jgi:hypothetical protein
MPANINSILLTSNNPNVISANGKWNIWQKVRADMLMDTIQIAM